MFSGKSLLFESRRFVSFLSDLHLFSPASQKIHIRTFPLGEMPRRIVHLKVLRAFCVITTKFEKTDPSTGEFSFVRLFDDRSFEALDSFRLQRYESGCSLSCMNHSELAGAILVVGTAFSLPGEEEPTRGRLLFFSVRISPFSSLIEIRWVHGNSSSYARKWFRVQFLH